MTDIIQTQLNCLEKELVNLEIKKEKDLSRAKNEEETQKIQDYYNSEFDRVYNQKQNLLKT